ncbi:hypothetical protein PC116_g2663 [Phytophthora cactorum]|nr:hypothetical protein PC116_g2663 [Phytophthora cactorum]
MFLPCGQIFGLFYPFLPPQLVEEAEGIRVKEE